LTLERSIKWQKSSPLTKGELEVTRKGPRDGSQYTRGDLELLTERPGTTDKKGLILTKRAT
jgi:hypothetical protein